MTQEWHELVKKTFGDKPEKVEQLPQDKLVEWAKRYKEWGSVLPQLDGLRPPMV